MIFNRSQVHGSIPFIIQKYVSEAHSTLVYFSLEMFRSFRLTFLELTTYRGFAWIVQWISVHPARGFTKCFYFQCLLSLSLLSYRPHEALPRNTLSYVSWDKRQDPTKIHTARFVDMSFQSPFYLFREQKPSCFF